MENNRNWAGIAALVLAGLALLVALVGRGGPNFDFSAHLWNGGPANSAAVPQAIPVVPGPGAGAQLPADAAQAQADAQAKIAQAQADAQAKIAQAQADAQAKIAQAQGKIPVSPAPGAVPAKPVPPF